MFRAVPEPEPVETGESAGYSATNPVPLSVLGLRWGSG